LIITVRIMKTLELNKIDKPVFSISDIAETLRITYPSAVVAASRYSRMGILTRLKNDLYALTVKLPFYTEEELFRIANLIQTPSYVSLNSALSYYNFSTQQLRGTIESIALKRTKSVELRNLVFSYTLIRKDLYTGFELKNGFFIATPEKALADCIYLAALKRRSFDFDAIEFKRLDMDAVNDFLGTTDKRVKSYRDRLCVNYRL
jgi:predicted transcriptional regulator of viral defense system